jgi:tripartite-type tricarboxylate transporter receptor subunit TctC
VHGNRDPGAIKRGDKVHIAKAVKSACLAAALAGACAHAETFPARPVRIVVPAPPGGALDITARLTAQKLQEAWNQSVVVENRPGASNISGTDVIAKSPPDGYNLLICSLSQATNPSTVKHLPYDSVKDFEPVVFAYEVPLMLVVNPGIPAKNVKELVAWIKANPDTASFASSGTGSSLQMAAELFKSMTGTKMLHVPYKGSTAAHPDVLSGRVSMIFDTLPAVQAHAKAGALRAIAVTTLKRSPSMPDVPTMAEQGLAGYNASSWGGILAPAGTPRDVVMKLNAGFNQALAAPDVKKRLNDAGIEITGGTPQQFGDFIRAETVKWARVAQQAGIRPE